MSTAIANQLFLAYLGRPADVQWQSATGTVLNGAAPSAAMQTAMYNAAVADGRFSASDTPSILVNKIFTNLFGFGATTFEQTQWGNLISNGTISAASAAWTIFASYLGATNVPASYQQPVQSKLIAIQAYTTELSNNPSANVAFSQLGSNAAAAGRTFLDGVTSQATAATAISTVASTVSTGSVAVGSTFAFTANTDNLTGTSSNDGFNATIVTNRGTGTTFGPGDVAAGGSGTDTLTISVSGTHTANQTHSAVTLSGIERVLVNNFETDNGQLDTFDASLWTGVTTVGLAGSAATGDVSFTNLGNVVGAEMGNGSADLTVTYLSTLLTGTADTQALELKAATGGTFTVSNGATGYAETLNITSSQAANTITLADNRHQTINITGSQNLSLTMTDGANATKVVNASALTGNLTLSRLGTTNIAITGGSGNDIIVGANIDASDTINGGAGTDTFRTATAVTAAAAANITNFETLEVTGNGVTQAANALAGITLLSVNDTTAGSGNGTITFNNAGATQSLRVVSVGDADDDVTVTLLADTASDSIAVTVGTATAGVTFDVLTLSNYETVTINNAGAASTVGSFTSTNATSLTLNNTSTGTLQITAVTAANLATINASGSTGNVTVGAVSKASTITGGAGNDTFTGGGNADTVTGGAGNDTIDGGGGNDSISGEAGNDSITGGAGNDRMFGGDGNDIFTDAALNTEFVDGGAGNDTFRIATFSDLTSADTINGGDGTDTLSFTGDGSYNFTTDVTILANVSNVERISFTGLAGGNDTVTFNDANASSLGGTITVLNSSASASTWSFAGVLSTSSRVVFSSDSTGEASAQTVSISNGVDSITLGSAADIVLVSNSTFLTASDTIAGGTGSDTLRFSSTSNSTITASQLANVTSFETFNINTGGAGNYALTLTDAIVGAQVTSGSTFTVTRAAGDTDTATLSVDGSAVTSAYNLSISGQSDASIVQTLTGGAGNDTITGGAGNDSLTGGSGNDIFVIVGTTQAANGSDIVVDFNFGTATTTVDQIQIDLTSTTKVFGRASGGITAAAGTEILVLDQASYADAAAAQTAARAAFGANDNAAEAVVIWQDSLGNLNLSTYADSSANATADGTLQTQMIRFSGLSLAGVGSLIDAGDFNIV